MPRQISPAGQVGIFSFQLESIQIWSRQIDQGL